MINLDGILAKLETTNPSGSVKDRMVWYMVEKAEERGELKPGMKIIEATSGNTGISFSMVSSVKGYEFVSVMPESMSLERRKMMESFGGKVILTPAEKDMKGAVEKYNEIVLKNKEAWLPKQFENQDNIKSHEKGLGEEIIREAGKDIDVFVAGIGTGGTLIGVAKALKKINPNVKIVGIEPRESAVLSNKRPGLHKIQGIGEGFIPQIVKENLYMIDQIVTVSSDDAISMREELAKKHGIFVGTSSGANFLVAKDFKEKYKNVVTIFPDRGERYLN